jgi:hypothetical protein
MLAPRDSEGMTVQQTTAVVIRLRPHPLLPRITPEEEAAHANFVAKELGPDAIWTKRQTA